MPQKAYPEVFRCSDNRVVVIDVWLLQPVVRKQFSATITRHLKLSVYKIPRYPYPFFLEQYAGISGPVLFFLDIRQINRYCCLEQPGTTNCRLEVCYGEN